MDNLKRHMLVHKDTPTVAAATPVNTVVTAHVPGEPVAAPAEPVAAPVTPLSFEAWRDEQIAERFQLHKKRHRSTWGHEECGVWCSTSPHKALLCTFRWSVYQYGGQQSCESLHKMWKEEKMAEQKRAEQKRAGLP